MFDKLREYIDELFRTAPPTKKCIEVKEEILQNLRDKFDDLIAEGKSEEAAYNIAVAGIGDLTELINDLTNSKEAFVMRQSDPALKNERIRSALLTSIAVFLYIVSVIPLFFLHTVVGLTIMFSMVGIATALLIFNNMSKTHSSAYDETIAGEFMQWRQISGNRKSVLRSISSALWAITVVIYMLISFSTHAWHVTWVIFLIAVALNSIIKAIFDVSK